MRRSGAVSREGGDGLHRAIVDCRFHQVKLMLEDGKLKQHRKRKPCQVPILLPALQIEEPIRRRRMFQLLVRHGADIYAMDEVTGRDILTWACFLDRTSEVVTLMRITHGDLPLTVRDSLGFTPLHYAAITGNQEVTRLICEVMVRHRLSVDIVDAQAVTPYIHAKRRHLPHVADILVSVGGASPHQFDPVLFAKPTVNGGQTPRARTASPPRSACSEPAPSRTPRPLRTTKRAASTISTFTSEVLIADEIANIKLTDDKKSYSARERLPSEERRDREWRPSGECRDREWRPSEERRDSDWRPSEERRDREWQPSEEQRDREWQPSEERRDREWRPSQVLKDRYLRRSHTAFATFPSHSVRDPVESMPILRGNDCRDALQKILEMRSMEMTPSFRQSVPGPEESSLGFHALASMLLRIKMKGARIRKQTLAAKTPRNTGSRASARFTFPDSGKGGGLLAALRSKAKVN